MLRPANLDLFTIPRLKVYRKKLKKVVYSYWNCWCGDCSCTHCYDIASHKDKKLFEQYKAEYEKVNEELGRRQLIEIRKKKLQNWANVPTLKEFKWLTKRNITKY